MTRLLNTTILALYLLALSLAGVQCWVFSPIAAAALECGMFSDLDLKLDFLFWPEFQRSVAHLTFAAIWSLGSLLVVKYALDFSRR